MTVVKNTKSGDKKKEYTFNSFTVLLHKIFKLFIKKGRINGTILGLMCMFHIETINNQTN